MDLKEYVWKKAKEAKEGAKALARLSSKEKNSVLQKMAEALKKKAKTLIAENQKDIQFAEKKGLSKALNDRLTLNEKRIDEMAKGLVEVVSLPDPVAKITKMWKRPNGMTVERCVCPSGSLGLSTSPDRMLQSMLQVFA